MKILFVFNPRAGLKKHNQTKDSLISYCKEKGVEYQVHNLPKDKDENALGKLINDFSPNAVIACGGDGTVNFVGSVLLGKDILFSIVPLGSANGLATALGIKLNSKRIIDQVLEKHFIKMDVLRINDKFNCFHLSSLGLNAQLVKKYDDADDKGMWGYAKHFFTTFSQKKPKKYTLYFNGTKIKKRADMVTFANAKKYGTGAVINPDGKIDDGKFEVCIFRPISWLGLFRLAYHFFFGNLKRSPFVKIVKTSKVKVVSKEKQILEVDGDLQGEYSEIKVEIQKGVLKMVMGEL